MISVPVNVTPPDAQLVPVTSVATSLRKSWVSKLGVSVSESNITLWVSASHDWPSVSINAFSSDSP